MTDTDHCPICDSLPGACKHSATSQERCLKYRACLAVVAAKVRDMRWLMVCAAEAGLPESRKVYAESMERVLAEELAPIRHSMTHLYGAETVFWMFNNI